MKQILSPPWPIRFALFDTEQENKFLIFGPCRWWRRQTRQKTVKFSVLQTQLAFFPSSWDSCIFVRANYFCFTVNPLSTKHVRSRRLNISLFGFFFMNFHFVSIHNNAKRKKLGEYSNLHLTLRQERIFICIYAWQVKFFLQFLASTVFKGELSFSEYSSMAATH